MPSDLLTNNRVRRLAGEVVIFACIVLLPHLALSLNPSQRKPIWFGVWAFVGAAVSYWLTPLTDHLFVLVARQIGLSTKDNSGFEDHQSVYYPIRFPERLLRSLVVGILGFLYYCFFYQ